MSSKIWIDLDNTPHVPFFNPIIQVLESKGFEVILTTRMMTQLIELAEEYNLSYTTLGKHAGKSKFKKIANLFTRAIDCFRFLEMPLPDLAISHGARSQLLTANLLRIPTVEFIDYEHVATPPFCRPSWEIAPDCYPLSVSRVAAHRFRTYPGIKEDVYAAGFTPSNTLLNDLGIPTDKIVITVRPPATEAHYHNAEADQIFEALLERIQIDSKIHAIIIPRNERQKEDISNRLSRISLKTENADFRSSMPESFKSQFTIPIHVLSGLDLIWESDLVVGGGGTMTREAAALDIPSYSFFRGTPGAVDTQLVKEKRLTLIEKPSDIESKILFKKKATSTRSTAPSNRQTLDVIIKHIECILH